VPIAPPATPPPLRFPLWASEEEFCPLCTSYLGEYPGDGQPDDEGATGRWRGRIRRVIRRTAKTTAFLLVLVATAIGVLAVTTPSAGQATTLAQAMARSRHISWPGPPVPERFAQALVATEDHRFYSEPGIDPFAVGRVLFAKVTGGPDQGGSTIEYQLARMLYTPVGSSGLATEAENSALAVKLNLTYSKQQILALYAEAAYYGQGYYGLQAAACGYFGRPPARLTIAQAALLAGLVNAPSADDPVLYPAAAHSREQHVLSRMVATGYLTPAEAGRALRQPLGLTQTAPVAHGAPGCAGLPGP
jgi:penicillin-binding protein 1A